jgi:hypothetical protein
MKETVKLFNRLINLKILNIEDFYTTTQYKSEIDFQGKYTSKKMLHLKTKGFKLQTVDVNGYFEYSRNIQEITIKIILTD